MDLESKHAESGVWGLELGRQVLYLGNYSIGIQVLCVFQPNLLDFREKALLF